MAPYTAQVAFGSVPDSRRGEDPAAAVPEIREAHLRQVVLMSAAFKEYMKATHDDLEDPDHALVLGNRDDRFYQKSGGS